MISWMRFCPLFVFCMAYAHAAALDKSGQSITAFLQEGNYAEFSVGQIQGDIIGEVPKRKELIAEGITDFSTANLMHDLTLVQASIKLQLHPQLSVALLYDQPFSAEVGYHLNPPQQLSKPALESTYFNFQTESLSLLFGFQPNKQWNFFSGLSYQSLEANLKLQGQSFSIFDGYQARIETNEAIGGIFGISYQIPAYAFRSTLSYRSQIHYKPLIKEGISGNKLAFIPSQPSSIKTPQSINLDFQTGIMPKTLLYSSLRWVDWSKFAIQPTQFDSITQAVVALLEMKQDVKLVDYQNDQWSITLGIARQLSNKWAMSLDSGWDSGVGNPASTLAPIDSLYYTGVNARYKFNAKTFMIVGMRYIWFNPADASDPNTLDITEQMTSLAHVNQNTAIAYGFKIGHSF